MTTYICEHCGMISHHRHPLTALMRGWTELRPALHAIGAVHRTFGVCLVCTGRER